MVVCGSLLLSYQPSARTRSPPTVWVEVLLLGRQPSARDRRDPLVMLAVQLASLFGNWPAACGAQRPGRQLSGGKMSGAATAPELPAAIFTYPLFRTESICAKQHAKFPP
ncbi:hypothetical protein NQZ68_035385 [Dissostichus eleginoides]|nr:hypothetical protein NQZ68_035385 [Dissostichus eleginoides]